MLTSLLYLINNIRLAIGLSETADNNAGHDNKNKRRCYYIAGMSDVERLPLRLKGQGTTGLAAVIDGFVKYLHHTCVIYMHGSEQRTSSFPWFLYTCTIPYRRSECNMSPGVYHPPH